MTSLNLSLPQILKASEFADRAEQDCACPQVVSIPSETPGLDAGILEMSPQLYHTPLAGTHELLFNLTGRAGVTVLNDSARCLLEAFSTPTTLSEAVRRFPELTTDVIRSTVRQFVGLDLLRSPASVRSSRHPEVYSSDTLTVWLHITDRCNLSCAYCYAPKDGRDMDVQIGRAAVDAVFRSALSHGFHSIKLKYGGGEPTLRFSVVERIHAYARSLAERNELELREVILSNGVDLTPEMLRWLRGEGVRLAVSLDGVGEATHGQRRFRDGTDSSALVSRGIDRALEFGVSPHLSITVTARNVDSIADVVDFALARDLLFNLNFVRSLLGCVDLVPTPERLIVGLRSTIETIESHLPRHRLIGGLLDRCGLNGPHAYPCGAGHFYLVVDPEGRVACCQMKIEETVGSVWAEDPLEMVRQLPAGFRNPPVDEKEECQDCLWRYWCAGGCPLVTRQEGPGSARSPYCIVYRTMLPELLRLEGLRLLKFGSPDV